MRLRWWCPVVPGQEAQYGKCYPTTMHYLVTRCYPTSDGRQGGRDRGRENLEGGKKEEGCPCTRRRSPSGNANPLSRIQPDSEGRLTRDPVSSWLAPVHNTGLAGIPSSLAAQGLWIRGILLAGTMLGRPQYPSGTSGMGRIGRLLTQAALFTLHAARCTLHIAQAQARSSRTCMLRARSTVATAYTKGKIDNIQFISSECSTVLLYLVT